MTIPIVLRVFIIITFFVTLCKQSEARIINHLNNIISQFVHPRYDYDYESGSEELQVVTNESDDIDRRKSIDYSEQNTFVSCDYVLDDDCYLWEFS